MTIEMHAPHMGAPAALVACSRIGVRPIGHWRTAIARLGARELQRRDAVAALEMLGERALVVEADGASRPRPDRRPPRRWPAGRAEPDLRQIGMRRQADRALEQADELEGREARRWRPGPRGEGRSAYSARIRSITWPAARGRAAAPRRPPPLPWRWNSGRSAPTSSSRSWNTSRPSSSARCIARKAAIRSRSPNSVAREVRHARRCRGHRPRVERLPREVERAVPPALAAAHPAAMRLLRIEHEQGRRRRVLHLAAALHHRAALLGDGDHQGVVGVRRIFVRREIGVHQAEAGEMAVPPVLRRVPGIDARHGQFLPIPAARHARATSRFGPP